MPAETRIVNWIWTTGLVEKPAGPGSNGIVRVRSGDNVQFTNNIWASAPVSVAPSALALSMVIAASENDMPIATLVDGQGGVSFTKTATGFSVVLPDTITADLTSGKYFVAFQDATPSTGGMLGYGYLDVYGNPPNNGPLLPPSGILTVARGGSGANLSSSSGLWYQASPGAAVVPIAIASLPFDPAGTAATAAASRVAKSGDTMTGPLTVGANILDTDGSVSFAGGNLTSDVSGNATANSLTVESLLSNGNFTCEAFSASSGPELVLVSNCTISDSGNNTLIMPDNVGGMTFPGPVTASGGITGNLTGIGETVVALGSSLSGTVPVDYSEGEVALGTLAGAVAFTFANLPAISSGTLTLRINGDGAHSMTFPAAVNWGPTGAPAQPVASGKRLRMYFSTEDGGTTIDAAWGGPF